MQCSTLTHGFSCGIPERISLFLSFPSNQSVIVDHILAYYIFLSIARLVGFIMIELYPIPGVPSGLGPHQVLRVSFAHWIIS